MSFSMSGAGGDVNRDVTITFIGKDNASAAMRNISGTATRTTTTAQRLARTLKYVGLAAATALAAGAALAAKALYDATKAAYYDDIAMKKLAFTQRKAQDASKAQTDATADLIDKLELATGIADDEMRPAMAALAGTGMEVKESQDLLNLALDVSVARGKSVQTVSEALAKAYNGQITGLTRLGIKTTDASGETLKFSDILKQLKERFGGAARAAGRTDPIKRLGAAYHQLQEEVGRQLLPMLRRFSGWIINTAVPWIKGHLVPWIKRAANWLGKNLPKAAQAISDWWNSSGRSAFTNLWNKIKDLWKGAVDLVAALTGKGKGDSVEGSFEKGGKAAEGLADSLAPAVDLLNKLVDAATWLEEHGEWISRLNQAAGMLNVVGQAKMIYETRPSWLGGGDAAGGWLPRAQGGWLVGEHGPEIINPRGFVKTHSQTMGASGGGGTVIHIHGAIDPVSTARQVERILAKGGRVTGRGALAVG